MISEQTTRNGRGRFLGICAVIFGVYLLLSFTMKAFADPPTSPFTPGETLNPSCAPTDTNCTVLPPLFSTTTLPMGGVLYMNDTSGTVSANTSSLYWNAASSTFQIGGNLLVGATSAADLSPETEDVIGSFGVEYPNGTDIFQVATSGSVTEGTSTSLANSFLYIASTSPIFSVLSSGAVGIGTSQPSSALQVVGTITANAVSSTGLSFINATGTGNLLIGSVSSTNYTGSGYLSLDGAPTFSTSTALLSLGSSTQNLANGSGTYIGINTGAGFNGLYAAFQNNSSTLFSVASSGAMDINENGATSSNIFATAVPTQDLFHIANASATAVNTAGVNALSVFYVGGAGTGGIESAAERIDIAPGASGTWSGLRIVSQSTTAAGVNENGIKIDSLANPGPGTETGIQIGTGWDKAISILGGPLQSTSTALLSLGSSTQNLANGSGTYIGINTGPGFNGSYLTFQNNSSTIFNVASSGALTIGTPTASILYASSNGLVGALGIGSGLSLSAGTLTATGGGGGGGYLSSGISFTTSTISYSKQLDATTTVVMVQGTVASTSVYKYTVPGNTLGTAGAYIRVDLFGTVLVPTTHPLSWLVYYGGQLLSSSTSNTLPASGNKTGWNATFYLSNASATTNNQIGALAVNIGAGTGASGSSTASGGVSTVDSTVNQTLEVDLRDGATTAESSTVNSVQTTLVAGTTTVVTGIIGGVGTAATSSNFYFPFFTSTSTLSATSTLFYSSSTGNIGIGTTTPGFALSASGTIQATGGFLGQCLSSGGFNSTSSGSCNMDLAESYPTREPTEAGDIVAIPIDATSSSATSTVVALQKSRGGDGETVIGVVSTNPGLVFDNGNTYLAGANDELTTSTEAVVALAGRVPVKISAANGPIVPGDLLAASIINPGVAVLATGPGTVIGEALQAYSGPDDPLATTTPEILVFINPHWAPGNVTNGSSSSPWTPVGLAPGGPQMSIEQITQYIQTALSNLGVVITNGVATLKGIVAQTVTTNVLCVQNVCINSDQLGALLRIASGTNSGSGGGSGSGTTIVPPPVTPPDSGGGDNGGGTPAASSTDLTPPSNSSSTDASSTSGDVAPPTDVASTTVQAPAPTPDPTTGSTTDSTSDSTQAPAPVAPAPTPASTPAPAATPAPTQDSAPSGD